MQRATDCGRKVWKSISPSFQREEKKGRYSAFESAVDVVVIVDDPMDRKSEIAVLIIQ